MRTETDLQFAHDVLHFVLTREAPPILSEREREHVRTAHDALAWALGSGCGRTFGVNLDRVIDQLANVGLGFVDAGVVTATNPLENPS